MIDIKKKYNMEINFIIQRLEQLENGDFCEHTGNKISGSAKNIARNIKEDFYDLLDKIENNKESVGEELNRKVNNKSKKSK